MSIIDSQVDLDEAKLRIGAEDEAKLVADLAYWSVAEVDHHQAYREQLEKAEATLRLHAESQRWTALIAAELHRRREAKRAKAAS